MAVCVTIGLSRAIVVDLGSFQDSPSVDKILEVSGAQVGRFDAQDEGDGVHTGEIQQSGRRKDDGI
jgi:hypothetical protein